MATGSLRRASEFERALRAGRRSRRDGVTVFATSATNDAGSRLGLAVRTRGAVARNRTKRRLRSAWRSFRAAPGYDVVVRAEREATRAGFHELERHLHEALVAAGVPGGRG